MENLPKYQLLKFHPDTLEVVRKIYGFNSSREMGEAIDILYEWVQKQDHFVKKDFNREYLERIIISCKGSVERAKTRMDKMCTLRTLLPNFFEDCDPRKDLTNFGYLNYSVLPKLTKDHDRIIVIRHIGSKFDSRLYFDGYKYCVMLTEYLRAHDYIQSNIIFIDLMKANLGQILPELNISHLRQIMTIVIDNSNSRVKGIHFLTLSKFIVTLISIMKQCLNAKIGGRFFVHKTLKSVHEILPKELLPVEYGGEERSIETIDEDWIEALSSEDYRKYRREMKDACVNEAFRQIDSLSDQFMGISGTFRNLTVD